MSQPFEKLAALDRLIHEPARLAILTALSQAASVDFLFLQRITGLTKGNLSSHLSKLEGAGLIHIDKEFLGKMPNTTISLTPDGQKAITAHWKVLEEMSHEVNNSHSDANPDHAWQ